ncbi:MAG: transcription accessory protein, partial [Chlamydiales bacterium]|nr:transcription accessory protein [Chlamydiales bacterium]
ATGNLDEVAIRDIQERFGYLLEMSDRRRQIVASIEQQGKMTGDLLRQIEQAETKSALEDLYLPYKPKRRTRAMIAREKGLEPLATLILAQKSDADPEGEAAQFLSESVPDVAAALKGALDIIAEVVAENAAVRSLVREAFFKEGVIHSLKSAEAPLVSKFEQYYDFQQKVSVIPSHRYLAIRRGEKEGALDVKFELEREPILGAIQSMYQINLKSKSAFHLQAAIEDSYKRLLFPSVETDVRIELKMNSDKAAVDVFADNLRHLLLAAPYGAKRVIGIDPGLRTGCKMVALDDTGHFLDSVTIYPSQGDAATEKAKKVLLAFVKSYQPQAIAVGNGTAGRETEKFVRDTLAQEEKKSLIVSVSESGASVYSASDIAREEFPTLDVTIRGAISIARRLQDPLAELVKIDPKSIGVGQYQHDVHQPLLQQKLDDVVESCVNQVGVDLNTASAPLLARVAGVGPKLAQTILSYRQKKGCFASRFDLLNIPGLGPKTFQQAAGFLRIHGAVNPLDSSAVHPESYQIVETIAGDMGVDVKTLVGNPQLAANIDLNRYVTKDTGLFTLQDIVEELKKPGRDPRDVFETAQFLEHINRIEDLKLGMVLEGIVTNVTAFGAFVDIGVHQDGLVHLSELSHQYIKDPRDAVKTGQKVQVTVLEVDVPRKRISLSAKGSKPAPGSQVKGKEAGAPQRGKGYSNGKPERKPERKPFLTSPFEGLTL